MQRFASTWSFQKAVGRRRRAVAFAAAGSALVLGLAACGSSSGGGSTAKSGASSDLSGTTVTVMVNTPQNLAYIAFEAASELETFPASGPKVKVLVGTDPSAAQALAANSVDVAVISGNEAATVLGKGLPAKLVAANSYRQIQSMIVSKSYAAKYGSTFADLKHARFGVSGATSVGALIDASIAQHFGFKKGDGGYSDTVFSGGQPALVAAFKSGAIDAFAWDPAVLIPLQDEGDGTVLGPVAPYLTDAVGGAILASSKAISSKGAAIRAVLMSYFAEVRKLIANPSLAENIMTKTWGNTAIAAKADITNLNSSYYSPDGVATPALLAAMVAHAKFANPDLPNIDTSSVYKPFTTLG